MLETTRAYGGMVTAPHHLASLAGLRVLREGGNAIEAMVAAAATISVVYPHMNALGGDNFWLIHEPGKPVVGIDACGPAAAAADIGFYRDRGHAQIPSRGALAALTVGGAVGGWDAALRAASGWGRALPLSRLLEDAVHYADTGAPVPSTLANNIAAKRAELADVSGWADAWTPGGQPLSLGERLTQPRIAETLRQIGREGADGFYRGELARRIAADLARAVSPVTGDDLARFRTLTVQPLSLSLGDNRIFNMPPPTQGLASLILLGVFRRLGVAEPEGFDFVHGLIESTKQAFKVRDAHVTDPAYMPDDPARFLTSDALDDMAANVDRRTAAPWPPANPNGDTVWLGAIDAQGRAVSFIQSIYWEFGSGVVLEDTGITWQNRGTSFSLDPAHHNALAPGRRPFHTIQPALAQLGDGRTMAYGTMGGEGQPQTQAMVYARHVMYGQDLQAAITAPRWLLGRTWGAENSSLRIENRVDAEVISALRGAGHPVEQVGPFDEVMGHAGALVHHPGGLIEGATDPRSDGAVVGI